MGFVAWEAAERCTGGPEKGAVALMAWVLGRYERQGAYNLGIYNCRTVRGGATTSLHGEGRALDIGLPMSSEGRGTKDGHAIVERFRRVGEQLGIQCMIYDRRIWSARSPDADGRPYTGVSPHYNHIHLELSRSAARNLTSDRISGVMGGRPVPPPRPVRFGRFNTDAKPGERRLRLGSAGDDVMFVQSFIGEGRCGTNDGYFGRDTKAGVRWYQDLRGVRASGVVDGDTWAQLLGTAKPRRPQR